MSIFEHPVNTLAGEPSSLAQFDGSAHADRQRGVALRTDPAVHRAGGVAQRYGDRGFNVVGFPCNQFGEQEPGTAEEIQTFCSTMYGVTFPMMEKIDVNGPGRHPIYAELTTVADAEGHGGDIRWNFEKFLVGKDGSITRFSPIVEPQDPAVVAAIEAELD